MTYIHTERTRLKAEQEIKKYERTKEQPDMIFVPPHRTASGCRFGYWKKVNTTNEEENR